VFMRIARTKNENFNIAILA